MVLEFLKLCIYYVIFWFYSILHKKRASYNLKDLTKTNNTGDWLAEKLDKNERYIIEGSAENGDHLYIELDTVNKEAFLILQVGESLFTLPGSYVHVLGFDEDSYLVLTAGPLRIELRDPFRRWRIVIRGILRADDGTDHFVRFHAWWFPTSDPNYFLQSLSPTQLAETACALDNLYFVKELENRNDFFQWGLVKAHILVDGSNEYFLDFRGVRIRTLPLDSNSICITDFFVSYMKHGNRILLYRVHCPETSYHIKGGSFFYSNLHQKSIDIFPNNFSEFTLNGKTYSLHQNEKSDFSFQFTKSITKLKYLDISLSDDQDNGYGYMVSTKPVWNQEKGEKFKESIKVLNHKASPTEQKLKVLRLAHQACRDPTLAGGKGSNLAKLSGLQDTFSVPPGVVVMVSAYLEHLEGNPKLKYLIEKVDTNEDLMEIEKLIKEEFLRSLMSPELKDEIIVQLQRIFGKDRLGGLHFAVRSSAVGEDGTELSSAGQLETFLQVPIKNISEKILECWASNFRHEIVRYRKENGQLLNVPVAVVIQEMVENGTISGVMFTNDPVKGDPSFLVINMIEGLGEELVSGQKTPSETVMKKSLEFIKKPKNMLISEEKCRELAKVGILLEEAFNAPQDIEFVVKDGEIFVVQSRNITNLDLETEWELEHEFDRAVATEDDVISTANVGEVLPYAISPLTCDFVLDIYDRSIHALIYGEDVRQAPQFQHYAPIFKVYQQRLFFNLIDSYMRNWETLSKDRIPEYALAGTKIFTDEMLKIGSRRYPKLSRMDHIRKLKFLAKVLFFESKNYLPMAKKYLDDMDSIKISSYDSKATISALMQQRDFMCQILFLHASASMYSSFTYVFVAMILRGSAEGDLTPEILSDIATIYSRNTYEIVSADVPKSMKKLAKAIYEEDLQEKFKSMENPQTAIDWLLSLGSKSGELARTFMETHGHRGLNELALLGVAWRDDPGHLVKNLRSLLDDNNLMNMSEDSPNSNVDVMDGLRTKVEGTKRLFLKFMISHAHRGVYIREEAKNYLVKATCILRENLLRLGSILKEQKYLPEERMIFFMTWSEIQQLISTRSPRILCRIRRRQKILEKQNEIQYPFINQGTPQPKELFKFEDFGDDVELFGTAVCEGRVVGHVRVAKTLEEAHLTQPGDILITKYTDIGWSPLFPIIKGLVTEIGGLLSHGAVVAREYGLPCVIAVENATDVFRTGDQVLLDSTKGIIKRIKN